ncbi:MAG: NAD(P)H-dependent oxidoreductase subunit E, partial [Planctomycetota bacterium]
APRILEEVERLTGVPEGKTSEDLEYSVETVACVGCCALAPVIVVNKDVVNECSAKKLKRVFKKGKKK